MREADSFQSQNNVKRAMRAMRAMYARRDRQSAVRESLLLLAASKSAARKGLRRQVSLFQYQELLGSQVRD
jgi:hypothetical protein